MTDKKLFISCDEFATAIVASRIPNKSMKEFLATLISPGPKEKHAGWIKICEYIRQSRNIPKTNKKWRKDAHEIFLDNLTSIEFLVWSKVMLLPPEPNDTIDIYFALESALKKLRNQQIEESNKMSINDASCSKELLDNQSEQ